MSDDAPNDQLTAGGWCVLAFIVLVTAKAMDAPIDWWIVTFPITGRWAFLVINGALGNK